MNLLLKFFTLSILLAIFSCKKEDEKAITTQISKEEEVAVFEEKEIPEKESLVELASKSVHIGEFDGTQFSINKTKEKEILEKMKVAINTGERVTEEAIFELVARDGTGENQLTSKKILQLLLENYKATPKQELLDKLLLSSILTTNHEIVAYLIFEGAKPNHDDITEVIRNIAPDYYPEYETMRLLVEKLNFDLYKNCDVTLLWWAIQEDNFFGTLSTKKILDEEFSKRRGAIFLKCNRTNAGEPFFDQDLFPTDKSAFDLAKSSENQMVKDWASKLKEY